MLVFVNAAYDELFLRDHWLILSMFTVIQLTSDETCPQPAILYNTRTRTGDRERRRSGTCLENICFSIPNVSALVFIKGAKKLIMMVITSLIDYDQPVGKNETLKGGELWFWQKCEGFNWLRRPRRRRMLETFIASYKSSSSSIWRENIQKPCMNDCG